MIIRAKAPLRIGLAGGGTDLDLYANTYGGAILNSTISMFAYASIEPRNDNRIALISIDGNKKIEFTKTEKLEINGELDILKGVYNNIVANFTREPLSFTLTVYVDAPPGSGLGSSSTLTVAIIGAFSEWLNLPLGDYDIANLAYEIERIELGISGGKQDQYAATFGGINYMEFYNNNKVIVNPLRIKQEYINELEFNFLLYYSGQSRLSSKIIDSQVNNIKNKSKEAIEAMHKIKEQAIKMKEAILKGNFKDIGNILNNNWINKKQTAKEISNPIIEEIYKTALKAGAAGGKISGAGGGGFMFFYCPDNTRYNVIKALQKFGCEFRRFQLTKFGLTTWKKKKHY